MSDFIRNKIKWEQARYNRRTYERLIKLLKWEAENTKIRDSRYCRDFLRDLKDAVQNGFPPDFTPSPKRNTLLSYAVDCCHCQPSIIHALIQAGADVNRPNPNGETALLQYMKGYYLIIADYYGWLNYTGIDNDDEAGKIFSEILSKTTDVEYTSPNGYTAMSLLCGKFLWSKTHSVQNIHSQELLAARIYELLDAGASFERFLAGQDTQSKEMKDLIRLVYEYLDYKDMTENVADQDIASFVR